MTDYQSILFTLPQEFQSTLLQLAEAIERNLRSQLAPREDVIDVRALANGLVEAQQASAERMEKIEEVLHQLAETQLEFAEAQKRTEQRIEELAQAQKRTEQHIEELTQAQKRTEQRIEELTQAQRELAQAQKRTEQRIEELTQAQKRTEQRIEELTQAQTRTEQRIEELTQGQEALTQAQRETQQSLMTLSQEVGQLTKAVRAMQPRLAKIEGRDLERLYVERAPSYFGRWLRQIDILWPGRLDRKLEESLDTALTGDEREEVLRLDAILRGKAQFPTGQREMYVALEASVTVNMYDVERVFERAALLRRLGAPVAAVVAGEVVERDAEEYALAIGVAILHDGKRLGWEQALAMS
jgi:prefoldin subunit 5